MTDPTVNPGGAEPGDGAEPADRAVTNAVTGAATRAGRHGEPRSTAGGQARTRPGRRTIMAFAAAIAGGFTAAVGSVMGSGDTTVGLSLAVCLGAIGVGLVTWANDLPTDHAAVQWRDGLRESDADRAGLAEELALSEATVGRRPVLGYLLGGSLAALAAAVVAPLRSLGPAPSGERRRTSWTAGARLVSADGQPIVASTGVEDQLATVFPEGHTDADDSQVVLLRMPVDAITEVTIAGGSVDGWVAYSKICTHAGCSVGLFGVDDRPPEVLRQLVCPCHQSVFDPTDGARPVGGPAPRPLPQLPLAVDGDGHLIATADFDRPVGPAAWGDG